MIRTTSTFFIALCLAAVGCATQVSPPDEGDDSQVAPALSAEPEQVDTQAACGYTYRCTPTGKDYTTRSACNAKCSTRRCDVYWCGKPM